MVVTQQMFQGINSFALVAVPMFILAGDLMAQGKVSEKLVDFADSLFGFLKGGLSIVSVGGRHVLRRHLRLRGRDHRRGRLEPGAGTTQEGL
ncbi:MAG: TRAP transporter large permease subunit [Halomonas sp.]|uniref:TRAP transporter large permease subunit n=1 Tax=Halomonas sp. TaxID=1486246 RepID=UPI002ACE8299|nr:TRAP transporter large permease subunit [Halomonas sp.]MDZ7852760.1 TRAP transporter large permease subunit [Halomonas sp.]